MPSAGQHVVIIGGTKNIGFALAKATVSTGASVTLTGRDLGQARRCAESIGYGATGAACDLGDWNSIAALFETMEKVDHLVVTAVDRDHNTIREYRPEDSARTMLSKTVGYATAVAKALPKLTPRATITLFSGLSMLRPAPGSTTISMANGAIIGLMNSLAVELGPIRVNAVTPSAIAGTDAVDNADPVRARYYADAAKRLPTGSFPTAADIVAGVLFLQDCEGVSALNLVVDGGRRLV